MNSKHESSYEDYSIKMEHNESLNDIISNWWYSHLFLFNEIHIRRKLMFHTVIHIQTVGRRYFISIASIASIAHDSCVSHHCEHHFNKSHKANHKHLCHTLDIIIIRFPSILLNWCTHQYVMPLRWFVCCHRAQRMHNLSIYSKSIFFLLSSRSLILFACVRVF